LLEAGDDLANDVFGDCIGFDNREGAFDCHKISKLKGKFFLVKTRTFRKFLSTAHFNMPVCAFCSFCLPNPHLKMAGFPHLKMMCFLAC
jgi:hypothetical protein